MFAELFERSYVKLHNEMVLEGVGDPQIILPRTMKYLQDCINEIRSLSKQLSAPTLGKISLEESVTDLIAPAGNFF